MFIFELLSQIRATFNWEGTIFLSVDLRIA